MFCTIGLAAGVCYILLCCLFQVCLQEVWTAEWRAWGVRLFGQLPLLHPDLAPGPQSAVQRMRKLRKILQQHEKYGSTVSSAEVRLC